MLPDAPRPEWAGYFLVRPALPDEGIPAYPLAEAVLVFRATGGEAPADHVVTGLSMAEAAGLAGDHTGIRAGEGIATGGAVDPVRIAVLKSRVNHSIDMAWILMVGDRPAARVTDGRLLWLLRSGSLNIVFEPGEPDWDLRKVEQAEFEAGAAAVLARMRGEEAAMLRLQYSARSRTASSRAET